MPSRSRTIRCSKSCVWGESLGSGVAVALAAEKPVGRVILEAPFTSTEAVGALRYWYLPVRFLMKDQFHSDERIGKVTAPLLILHGVLDRTVPYSMGERMFELANKPKHIVRFLDGGHDDLDAHGALNAVARFSRRRLWIRARRARSDFCRDHASSKRRIGLADLAADAGEAGLRRLIFAVDVERLGVGAGGLVLLRRVRS